MLKLLKQGSVCVAVLAVLAWLFWPWLEARWLVLVQAHEAAPGVEANAPGAAETFSAELRRKVEALPPWPQAMETPPVAAPATEREAFHAALAAAGLWEPGLWLDARPVQVAAYGGRFAARDWVLAIDISTSMLRTLERQGRAPGWLRDAALEWLAQLQPQCRFTLIQFSRTAQFFRETLVAAQPAQVEAAREWIEEDLKRTGHSGRNWYRGSPDGLEAVLSRAFALEPEVVLIVGDADFGRTRTEDRGALLTPEELAAHVEALQASAQRPVEVVFVAIGGDPAFWQALEAAGDPARLRVVRPW